MADRQVTRSRKDRDGDILALCKHRRVVVTALQA